MRRPSGLWTLVLVGCSSSPPSELPAVDAAEPIADALIAIGPDRAIDLDVPGADQEPIDAGAADSSPSDAPPSDQGDSGVIVANDLDQDGLDDRREAEIADAYLPFLSVHPSDGCPSPSLLLFRLRPHPSDPRLLFLFIDRLFNRDCGAGGHLGDAEGFGATIDPALPPPAGILAIKSIAHRQTPCQAIETCGRCPGLTACSTAERHGNATPIVFYSSGKHGSYVSQPSCDRSCFLTNHCAIAMASSEPAMINIGEPAAPLVRDLTAIAAITATAGWDASFLGYDPWSEASFAGGGVVSHDLVDDAFLPPTCSP